MGRILTLQDEYLKRVCHIEPGNAKLFFKKLKESFNKEVEEIIKEL